MIHEQSNTIITGTISMVSLHLTAMISNPDISTMCQVAVTIATIAKFYVDYRHKRKKNGNNKDQ